MARRALRGENQDHRHVTGELVEFSFDEPQALTGGGPEPLGLRAQALGGLLPEEVVNLAPVGECSLLPARNGVVHFATIAAFITFTPSRVPVLSVRPIVTP